MTSMNVALLIAVLKYLGAIVSASYGIYAILSDFHINEGGKRRLTRNGYVGIAIFVISAGLTLSMNALTDLKEKEESYERRKAEQLLVAKLSAQVDVTNRILTQTLERADVIEIEIFADIDPLKFTNANGQSILSKQMQELLGAERSGIREFDVQYYKPLVIELQKNAALIRDQVFRDWELGIRLDGAWIRRQQTDGLTALVISHVNGEAFRSGVQCWITYRISPNRLAGLRTYRDFNGKNIQFSVTADQNLLDVTTIRIHFGEGGNLEPLFVHRKNFTIVGNGQWEASIQIPADYVK